MVGIDLVEVIRIKKFLEEKTNEQLLRVFTMVEIDYANASQNRAQRFAARFAVKEAFFKAFNFGNFNEIELNRVDKSPFITLYGETLSRWKKIGKPNFSVSVSHTMHYATAIVVRFE